MDRSDGQTDSSGQVIGLADEAGGWGNVRDRFIRAHCRSGFKQGCKLLNGGLNRLQAHGLAAARKVETPD